MRAEKHTDRVYHLSDFRLRTEPIDNFFRPQSRLSSQRRDVQRPLSQSERDWMYAKRALARGARLTVKKAEADMGRESLEATSMLNKLTSVAVR